MAATLFMVHGSHPCRTVARALELKGVAFRTVVLPPPSHVVVQTLLFGRRTVPGLRFEDGEKVVGSRAILARLEERVPEPALLPADPTQRTRVLAAERWADEVLQAAVRRILWPTLLEHPEAAPSFDAGAKRPLPPVVVRTAMPLVARVEQRMNATSAQTRAQDLLALPGWLDRLDEWLAEGVLSPPGVAVPNRADLQFAPSLVLLSAIEDLRGPIAARPCGQAALSLFDPEPGTVPAGALELPPALAGLATA